MADDTNAGAVKSKAEETQSQVPLSECRAVVLYSVQQPLDILMSPNKSWCARLLTVCMRGVQERYLCAWWSTLGGAHSALGDTQPQHALVAGQVSKQQLALAQLLGDELLIARCKLYLAFSLLQRGKYKKAAQIIREQYRFATFESSVKDKKLMAMCLAGWTRVQQEHYLTNLQLQTQSDAN